MNQVFGDGNVVKSMIKLRGITQVELGKMMKYSASRINIILSAPKLPEAFRERFIEVLNLSEDPFLKTQVITDNQGHGGSLKALLECVERLARQNETLLYQQTQILKLLQQSTA